MHTICIGVLANLYRSIRVPCVWIGGVGICLGKLDDLIWEELCSASAFLVQAFRNWRSLYEACRSDEKRKNGLGKHVD